MDLLPDRFPHNLAAEATEVLKSAKRLDALDTKARPTMQDVAEAAGVSLKTVSRVVNNEPRVDEKTKARVHKAIADLGFYRNDIARSLRRGQSSRTIGLVIEDIANPFYSNMARGIEKVMQYYHYMVITSNSEENALRERELVTMLLRRRVEGLLIVPAGHDHSYLTPELRLGLPIIFLDRPPLNLHTDTIVLDNRGGARKAVAHLITHGHTRIGMVGGNPHVYTGSERLAGYCEALAAAGIALDEALLGFDSDEPARAEATTEALLALPDPPTALFTTSNRISVAVLRALHHSGYAQRLALVGFDDFELADMLPTPITVVAHDASEMGRQGAELLFARLKDDERPPQSLMIPTELIIRGSGELPPFKQQ